MTIHACQIEVPTMPEYAVILEVHNSDEPEFMIVRARDENEARYIVHLAMGDDARISSILLVP